MIPGLFVLATIVFLLCAIPKNGAVRRWFATRQQPKRAVGLLVIAWILVTAWIGNTFPAPDTSAPAAAAAGTAGATPTATTTPPPPSTPAPTTTAPPRHTIVRVIDGDTVELDDGRTVRLLGVDAPEAGTICGEDATAFLSGFAYRSVTVTGDPTQDTVDRYGRTLAYLGAAGTGDLSVALAGAGHADYYDVGVPVQKKPQILAAAADARVHGTSCLSDAPVPPTTATPTETYEPEPYEPETYDEPNHVPDVDLPAVPRSEGKPGCNPLTARDGDGDGIVCER